MNSLLLFATQIETGDVVGFTFFIGSMAMLAATVFFFAERGNVPEKWTVPLMCVEFYLLTRPYGAKAKTLFALIVASVGMLVTGYIGEAIQPDSTILWGTISTLFYLYIVYEVFAGSIAKLSKASNNPALNQAMFLLKIFITLGWSVYPIGYMTMYGNLLAGLGNIDVIYNLADAINKIGFGLVIYYVATSASSK